MDQSPSWKATWFSANQEIPAFYGIQGSLPLLEVPATYPYPEPDQYSPCPLIPLPESPS